MPNNEKIVTARGVVTEALPSTLFRVKIENKTNGNGSQNGGQSTARVLVTPSHGVGRLVAPWQPGVSANPAGRPRTLKEVQGLARNKSLDSLRAMISIIDDKVIDADGHTRNVAAQTILTWAYGKPPDYDPRADKPELTIDLAVLSQADKQQLLGLLRRGIVREADPVSDQAEPVTIDAKPVETG